MRDNASMAYDASTQQIVLYGGITANGTFLGDTWTYADGQWQQRKSPVTPGPLELQAMTYDLRIHSVIMADGWTQTVSSWFGNSKGVAPVATDNLWVWNGSTWYLEDGSSGNCQGL